MAPVDGTDTLVAASDMGEAHELPFAGGRAGVFSTRCPGKVGENEDSALILTLGERRGVLAVADGLGGRPGGARASALALRCVREALLDDAGGGKGVGLRNALLDGLECADRAIAELGIGAGTTVAAIEFDSGVLRPYHVGDSGVLAVGSQGKVKLGTVPHAPVSYAVEAGIMDEETALRHPDRHLVSNIVGNSDMRIELGPPLELASRDTLLLATDGLFDNFTGDELVEMVRVGPLPEVCETLRDACLARMFGDVGGAPSKPDDLTFIVFRPNGRSSTA